MIRTYKWTYHVVEIEMSQESSGYDMIIGLDLMNELYLIINCENTREEWKELKIPMATSSTKSKNKKHLNSIL